MTINFSIVLCTGSPVPNLKDFTMLTGRFTSHLMVDVSQKQPCEDLSKSCPYFLKQQYCTKGSYVKWMKVNCRRSCKFCKPGPPVDGGWSVWVNVSECEVSLPVSRHKTNRPQYNCQNSGAFRGRQEWVISPAPKNQYDVEYAFCSQNASGNRLIDLKCFVLPTTPFNRHEVPY